MKILIGENLFDKTIFYQDWYDETQDYGGNIVEIDDKYSDCSMDDFDGEIFNINKYNSRILNEKNQRELIEYEESIVSLIRKKYSINQELAILRQRDTKPEEFIEYNNYVESCKQEIKSRRLMNG